MKGSDTVNKLCFTCEHSKSLHKKTGEYKYGHWMVDCKSKSKYDDYDDGLCHCQEFEYEIQQYTSTGRSRIHCVTCGKICCFDDSHNGGIADTANDVKVYCSKCYKE